MKSEDVQTTSAAAAQPTPPSEDPSNGMYASYVPHDIKYDSAFEDSVMAIVLDTKGSSSADEDGIQPDDVPPESLPNIVESDLPLPLSDPRRKFKSPVAGIRLTHPGGYLEGGPGLDPDMDTFVEDFVERNHDITSHSTEEVLQRVVQKEIDQNMEILRKRLNARRRAYEKNEQIERELKMMSDQHAMEMKVNRKLADERRAKKEAKARRRRGEK